MKVNPQILVFMFLVFGAARHGQAQAASDRQRSTLDGVYTEAQAARGMRTFRTECATCHTSGEFSGAIFRTGWTRQTIFERLDMLRSTMPFDGPGRLSNEQYLDVIAYILKQNGYPAGETELTDNATALKQIRIDPKPAP